MDSNYAAATQAPRLARRRTTGGSGVRAGAGALLAGALIACGGDTPTAGRLAVAPPSFSVAADTTWDTYSAVVTITTADPAGPAPAGPASLSYRVSERLQPDGSWNTTIEPRDDRPQATRGIARIETRAGTLHAFGRDGAELDLRAARHPATMTLSRGALVAGAPPTRGTAALTGGRARRGRGWAAALLARRGGGAQARLLNRGIFGQEPARDGARLRYSRQQGDATLAVTVDSLTGATLEVEQRVSGAVTLRMTNSYLTTPAGDLLLRERRLERGSAVQTTRYDSVSFTRGGR